MHTAASAAATNEDDDKVLAVCELDNEMGSGNVL